MLDRGKRAAFDVAAIAIGGVPNDIAQIGILPDEFWYVARRQTEQVVDDQDLTVAMGTRPDADGWDLERRGDLTGNRCGNTLQDDREGACLLRSHGIGVQPLGIALRA